MAKAEQFYDAAIAVAEETGGLSDAEVTLLVLAGIAAADVICCARLGVYAHGESHQEAVALLRRAAPGSAKHLNTLLGSKTKAEFGGLLAAHVCSDRCGYRAGDTTVQPKWSTGP